MIDFDIASSPLFYLNIFIFSFVSAYFMCLFLGDNND